MKVTLRPGLWLMMTLVFVITMGATLLMWSFLRGQETRRAQTLLVSASGSLQDRVQAELDQELATLQRMAAKWQIRPDMQREEWEYDVRQILESHPSLLSVAWLDNPGSEDPNRFRVTWALPTVYEPAVVKLHALVQESRPEMLRTVIQQRRIQISEPILVANRGKAFVVYIPSIVDGKLKGALVGLFHLQLLMDFVFDRLLASDYSILLMDGYEEIYRRGEPKGRPSDWEHQGALSLFAANYKLRLWPNPEVQRANEKLADLILMGGTGVAAVLTILVFFVSRRPRPKPLQTVPDAADHRRRLWEAAISGFDEAVLLIEKEKVIGAGPVVVFANDAFAHLTGFDSAAIIGKSPRALFGHDFATADLPTDHRVQLPRKSEAPIEVDLRAKPLRNEKQQITHWLVTFHTAGATAPSADEILGKLVANAPLPVQVFDLTGEVLHWNHLAAAVTGFSAEEMVGKATPLGVQFPTPSHFTRKDLRIAHKNGNRLDLAVWTAPLQNADGKFISFMADLTSEHVASETLAEREASFRALAESASDILAILDLESTLQYVNPAVNNILGLDPAKLTGASADALIEEVPAGEEPFRLKLKQLSGPPVEMDCKIEPIPGTPLLLFAARQQAPAADSGLLDAITDAILTYDTEHRVLWMNRAAEQLYGITSNFAKGKTLSEVLPDWLQAPGRDHVFSELDRQGFWKGEISNFTPGGREIVQDVSMAITYDNDKRPTGAVAVHRDVTAKKSAVDALAVNPLSPSEGLWDWNIRTGDVYFSPRWKEMLGYRDEEITGDLEEWFMLVHPDDISMLRGRITTYLKGQPEHLEVEYRARTRGGAYRWMMTRAAAMRSASGEITRLVGLQTDIHDQKQLDEQLLFEAFHDPLTGLDNRALFLDRLNGALAHPHAPFAVAFLDLKQFHRVNDTLGARGGDKALSEAGQRIAACLPPGSFTARHGSDEFVAMIPTADPAKLDQLLSLIHARLATPFHFGEKQVSFECSAGFAISTDSEFANGEAMLQAASKAMASGDANPKQVEHFDPNQFRVFYHPVVSLDTGEIYGIEALIRWQHPERGLLTPGEFLPAAEQSGLILSIDRWMLREACAKVNELNRRFERIYPLVLTVNLSGLHFRDAACVAQLEQIIHESGIDAAALRIEINTSSSQQLDQLPLDLDIAGAMQAGSVKLPLALVRGLASGRNVEKARAIILAARQQNLKVVAEGVESLEQLAVLRELKCDLAQGFYFTRPASANDTERLLARGPRW